MVFKFRLRQNSLCTVHDISIAFINGFISSVMYYSVFILHSHVFGLHSPTSHICAVAGCSSVYINIYTKPYAYVNQDMYNIIECEFNSDK